MKRTTVLFAILSIVITSLAFTMKKDGNEKVVSKTTEQWFYYSDLTGDHNINNYLNYEPVGGVPGCNSGEYRCAVYAETLSGSPSYPDMSTVGEGDIRNKPTQ